MLYVTLLLEPLSSGELSLLPTCHEVSWLTSPHAACHDFQLCLRPAARDPAEHGLKPLKCELNKSCLSEVVLRRYFLTMTIIPV
jgi:hypothetical protein